MMVIERLGSRWHLGTLACAAMCQYANVSMAATEPHAFTIDNQSDRVVYAIRARPSDAASVEARVAQESYEDGWGEDLLGEDLLPAGFRRQFYVDGEAGNCLFDVELNLYVSDGQEGHVEEGYVEYEHRNLCHDQTLTVYNPKRIDVVNEGETNLFYVRVSMDYEIAGWGDDLMGDNVLRPGRELTVLTSQHGDDQCVFDVLLEDDDGRRRLFEDRNICENHRVVFPSNERPSQVAALEEVPDVAAPPSQVTVLEEIHEDVLPNSEVGETFRDCDDWACPWMVVVEGGAYERGSRDEDDAMPVKEVTVPEKFAVGEFEVTVAQYREFIEHTDRRTESGCRRPSPRRGGGLMRGQHADEASWNMPGFEQTDAHPVVCVSWNEALAYTAWLAERTGMPYRLLTEAEWELLARGADREFKRSGRANCRDCGSSGSRGLGASPLPVGRFGADERGLYDLFGNASEWVQDCYLSGYANAPRDGSAWSPRSCEHRVVRGGSWNSRADDLRAFRRDQARAERRNSSIGFRVGRGPRVEAAWAAGEKFRDQLSSGGEGPLMAVVPMGSFSMGSSAHEPHRDDDEGPVHQVTFGMPFAMGVYEVSFEEWDACVANGGCSHRPTDHGWGRARRPVIDVSWEDARSYVDWLSRETNERYRLPSEAEWEYAARAGTLGPFHTGSTISTDQANYDGNYIYGSGREGAYRERTVRVGSFVANEFGLHDVHGNVWEWVEDCWNESYEGAPTDGAPWLQGDCDQRLVRGGSWYDAPRKLRSAMRGVGGSEDRVDVIGFRVVRTLTL